mmetsp:Transcript_21612/g.50992  ORF Transcript_21612/g.50992 Transcript_21612/m.50992 type:complete len:208 (+) Transcript_21612:1590-2213(+)
MGVVLLDCDHGSRERSMNLRPIHLAVPSQLVGRVFVVDSTNTKVSCPSFRVGTKSQRKDGVAGLILIDSAIFSGDFQSAQKVPTIAGLPHFERIRRNDGRLKLQGIADHADRLDNSRALIDLHQFHRRPMSKKLHFVTYQEGDAVVGAAIFQGIVCFIAGIVVLGLLTTVTAGGHLVEGLCEVVNPLPRIHPCHFCVLYEVHHLIVR